MEYFDGEPADIVRELSHRGFASAILGGGAYTNAMFLKAGLVEEILLTVEAKFLARDFFADGLDSDIDLQLMDVRRLGTNTVLLHYKFSSISAIPHVMVTEKAQALVGVDQEIRTVDIRVNGDLISEIGRQLISQGRRCLMPRGFCYSRTCECASSSLTRVK